MFKVGIIGVGYVGSIHLEKFSCIDGVCITAISDVDSAKVREAKLKFNVKSTYSDHRILLEKADLDLVVICVANHLHHDLTIEALELGHNVLCEKPMALNLKDARAMIEVSKRMKKTLLIVNNFRWDYLNPSIFQLKSMIESGWFGRIYHIRLNRIRSRTFPFNDYSRWNLDSRLSGGGVLIDLGPHMIDLGMWLASEYRVNAVLGSTDQGLLKLEKIDDFASGIIKLESGVTLQVDLSWSSHHKPSWKIDLFGDKGGASLRPDEGDQGNLKLFRLENNELKNKKLDENSLTVSHEKSLQQHVVKCIQQNVASDCSAENAYAVLESIFRWYKSA